MEPSLLCCLWNPRITTAQDLITDPSSCPADRRKSETKLWIYSLKGQYQVGISCTYAGIWIRKLDYKQYYYKKTLKFNHAKQENWSMLAILIVTGILLKWSLLEVMSKILVMLDRRGLWNMVNVVPKCICIQSFSNWHAFDIWFRIWKKGTNELGKKGNSWLQPDEWIYGLSFYFCCKSMT